MRDNFVISTDYDGNMPVLSDKPLKRYYVEYRNNKPINVVAYKNQDRVWDYSKHKMLSLSPGLKCHDGSEMPLYQGVIA